MAVQWSEFSDAEDPCFFQNRMLHMAVISPSTFKTYCQTVILECQEMAPKEIRRENTSKPVHTKSKAH